jgi:hypothetical protein
MRDGIHDLDKPADLPFSSNHPRGRNGAEKAAYWPT